jgi:hypothetical protein
MSDRNPMEIGGTAAAAIVAAHDGEPYYSTPWDVWAAAHGAPEDRGEVPALFTTGLTLEPILLDWWHREHGAGMTLARSPVIRHGWQVGHLDGLALSSDSGAIVVDPKTCLQDGIWFFDGADDIPWGYVVQLSWYARLVEAGGVRVERVEFPIWSHSRAARAQSPYLIRGFNWNDATREEAQRHLAIVEEFYQTHMITGLPPAFDGGRSAARWLALQIGPIPKRRESAELSADLVEQVEAWRIHRARAATAKTEADRLAQEIMQTIGDRRLYLARGRYVQVQTQKGSPFLAAHGFDKSSNEE